MGESGWNRKYREPLTSKRDRQKDKNREREKDKIKERKKAVRQRKKEVGD